MADELQYENRMSDSDALMWSIERDPMLRSTITAVTVFDQAPDRDVLMDMVERTSLVVPRLRQRVVGNPYSLAPPRWEVDPNFDLGYHLRFVNAPGEGTMRDLLDVAEPIAMQGFDRARPLWEFISVGGLADGRAGFITKIHHAITDGVGAIKIAMHLFDLEPEGWRSKLEPLPEPEVKVLNPLERLADGVAHEIRRQTGVLRRSAAAVRNAATDVPQAGRRLRDTLSSVGRLMAPANDPLSPIMRGRSLSAQFGTLAVPVEELKAAARKAGGRLNDAFVAGVLGGLGRYHEHHGQPVDELRMSMPINIRVGETENLAGNQFVPARFRVPLGIDDPINRMQAVRQLVADQRAEPALALVQPVAGLLYRMPRGVSTGVFGAMLRGVDLVTSNVPGVPIPVYLAGARMESQFAFGPMAGAATNITLVSYIDTAYVAVNSDPVAVPDGDTYLACLQDGFDEVRKLA
jgi:WS/DGAT/MGAT family acyltransferase